MSRFIRGLLIPVEPMSSSETLLREEASDGERAVGVSCENHEQIAVDEIMGDFSRLLKSRKRPGHSPMG